MQECICQISGLLKTEKVNLEISEELSSNGELRFFFVYQFYWSFFFTPSPFFAVKLYFFLIFILVVITKTDAFPIINED